MELYSWLHYIHFSLAAIWVAAATASHTRLAQTTRVTTLDSRRQSYRGARRITVGIEMPALGLLLLLGIALVAARTEVFTEGWFHVKLACVFLLIIFLSLAAKSQKKIGDILASASIDERPKGLRTQVHLNRTLRLLMAVVALILIFAVVFRFGEAETLEGLPEQVQSSETRAPASATIATIAS